MVTVDKLKELFLSKTGQDIYAAAVRAIADNSMEAAISSGVLVGFSGGPDSIMLLAFLLEYRRRTGDFSIAAVHVNHSIRGDEADRDELFSRELCGTLGVEFISRTYDVPTLAMKQGKGLEETARDVRYSCFRDIISGRNDISTIAVAHNATDNLETVLFNIMRGAGTRGAAGIAPVRGNIVRPLIYVPKADIISSLCDSDIAYAVDSTNDSVEYSRNRIRHNVIPELARLTSSPEDMAARLSRNLRRDDDYITSVAKAFLLKYPVTSVPREALASLHISVFSRVLSEMASTIGASVTEAHVDKLYSLIFSENFSYDICGGRFICELGLCRVTSKDTPCCEYEIPVSYGVTEIPEREATLVLSDGYTNISYSNVYNFSIQANLSSAIIDGGLLLRSKRDGDTLFFGGHTRKLKKLFNDFGIPPSLRHTIPVLCDRRGVLWVPGIGVRDDGAKCSDGKKINAFLSVGKTEGDFYSRFHIPSEFDNKKGTKRK